LVDEEEEGSITLRWTLVRKTARIETGRTGWCSWPTSGFSTDDTEPIVSVGIFWIGLHRIASNFLVSLYLNILLWRAKYHCRHVPSMILNSTWRLFLLIRSIWHSYNVTSRDRASGVKTCVRNMLMLFSAETSNDNGIFVVYSVPPGKCRG
jgi:hypothetical protein